MSRQGLLSMVVVAGFFVVAGQGMAMAEVNPFLGKADTNREQRKESRKEPRPEVPKVPVPSPTPSVPPVPGVSAPAVPTPPKAPPAGASWRVIGQVDDMVTVTDGRDVEVVPVGSVFRGCVIESLGIACDERAVTAGAERSRKKEADVAALRAELSRFKGESVKELARLKEEHAQAMARLREEQAQLTAKLAAFRTEAAPKIVPAAQPVTANVKPASVPAPVVEKKEMLPVPANPVTQVTVPMDSGSRLMAPAWFPDRVSEARHADFGTVLVAKKGGLLYLAVGKDAKGSVEQKFGKRIRRQEVAGDRLYLALDQKGLEVKTK